MATIVGKLLPLAILISSHAFAAQIHLKLTTIDGTPLKEAGIGQPFLLHAIIQNASNTAQYPLIKNIEKFSVKRAGFQMNMVNGTTSITYQHQVRIDEPGTYTIGPAQLVEDSGIVESEPITVTVSREQKSAELKKNETSSKATFLRLACTQDSAVVGQKIPITLTFYTADPRVSLQSIIEPDQNSITGFCIKHKEGPITGTQMLQGTEHRFAQWKWDIYPTKSGGITIPAYAVDFSIQSNTNAFSFFFAHQNVKRVYSNSITIPVAALPPSKIPAAYIGSICQFTAKLEPANARIGQGMTLILQLTGTGDFESLGLIPLHMMPESLKWYESKQHTQSSKMDGQDIHTMEYIVQALQPGDYEIPAQQLHYYDIHEHAYKTCKTMPLAIHVNAHAAISIKNNSVSQTSNQPESAGAIADTDNVLPLHQEWSLQKPNLIIPWKLYWIIMALMCFGWLLFTLTTFGHGWIYKKVQGLNKKNILYSHVRKQIQETHRSGNYETLYAIIINLLSAHCNGHATDIADEIEKKLVSAGLEPQALEDWKHFYIQIAETGFYKQSHEPYSRNDLIKQALYWIDIIEKLPRGNQ